MAGSVDQLRELLRRAGEEASALGGTPRSLPPVPSRPGYFAEEAGNRLEEAVERIAAADCPVTFVVGAGASMEAGLPSWASLVRGMLEATAPSLPDRDLRAWLEAIDEGGLLTAAAIARARCTDERRFRDLLWQQLYRNGRPRDFLPGPLIHELAAFKRAFPDTELLTFNYDDLLERALRDLGLRAESRFDGRAGAAGSAVVRHLHGRLDSTHRDDAVVLTEVDYARFPTDTWQGRVMERALDGLCVFVGLSFNDPNLLRWVYTGGDTRHLALLTRQSSPQLKAAVRGELEQATRARLRRAAVDAYWADFYGELAQVIHEARQRRGAHGSPLPFGDRAARRTDLGRRRCIPRGRSFDDRQRMVQQLLETILGVVRSVAATTGVDLGDEHLGLALWGVDHRRREVSLWASSDRLHAGPGSIVPLPLEYSSDWVAVEAVTQCNVTERDPRVYASRWRFVRGVPLVWTDGGEERIVVGAVTLTSTTPESALATLPPGAKREIDAHLQGLLVRLWENPPNAAGPSS